MKDVSIILVNYNTCEMTVDCIESILEKTKDIDFDIWVVDNASSDSSVETIKQKFPFVNLIESESNLGFGAGNNLALKKCDAKYVFCLNTDTILMNNAIKTLYDFMENDAGIGVCGGNLYEADGVTHNESFGNLETLKELVLLTFKLDRLFNCRLEKIDRTNKDNETKEVGYICGADMMIRKEALDKAGLFDEDFFFYYEESELQARIKDCGYKIFINPDARIIHLSNASSCKNKSYRKMLAFKSQYTYYKKRYKLKKISFESLFFTVKLFWRLFSHPIDVINIWKHIWSSK